MERWEEGGTRRENEGRGREDIMTLEVCFDDSRMYSIRSDPPLSVLSIQFHCK